MVIDERNYMQRKREEEEINSALRKKSPHFKSCTQTHTLEVLLRLKIVLNEQRKK